MTGIIRVDGKSYHFLGKEVVPPEIILPYGDRKLSRVKYTTSYPGDRWMKEDFDDAEWQSGKASFDSEAKEADNFKTRWLEKELWVRREFILNDLKELDKLFISIKHDNDFSLYINGIKAAGCDKCLSPDYQKYPIAEQALKYLKKGKNIVAVYCKNPQGRGTLDFGVMKEKPEKKVINAKQKSLKVNATQTIYDFTCGGIDLTVTFTTPLLMSNLEILSRPITYITFTLLANDNKEHQLQLFYDVFGEWAVNSGEQMIEWKKAESASLNLLSAGTTSQNILGRKGDDVRIDWGNLYLATPKIANLKTYIGDNQVAHDTFIRLGSAIETEKSIAREADEKPVSLGFIQDIGMVKQSPVVSHAIVGYDDLFSVEYFNTPLKAWWRRKENSSPEKLFEKAESGYDSLMKACERFDNELFDEAKSVGGVKYAQLCALSYRQAIAAHKLVASPEGEPLFLSKENFSNGSIGTVDVTYPSAPLFLIYNSQLVKGMMDPIFYYSESGKWTKPFPAHDLGTYPIANGQTYPEDMPVEECGNMLILTAAIAEVEQNSEYAKKHWKVLTKWAEYLKKEGFDPANQLSTDDFAGHLAHNTNLSVKAILGIASYGKMCGMLGYKKLELEYMTIAKSMVFQWEKFAREGDHYRLAFDQPGTWSLKYNLIWDELLDLNIFSPHTKKNEIEFYLTKQNEFGIPLDSRKTYTKSDWLIWVASLSENQEDFEKILNPVYKFVHRTPDRIPLSDWHETTNGRSVGFRARSVVGGYFIKILKDRMEKL